MRQQSLVSKTIKQFAICLIGFTILATPVFYWLTKSFYAEDMIALAEAVQRGHPIPAQDLEADIMQGVLLQFALIALVVSVSMALMIRVVSRYVWRPFDSTLQTIERFRLEDGTLPVLPRSNVEEFNRLNVVLEKLMRDNLNAFRMRKEFTENASHELQTPLAVFQSKLDLLMQQPDVNEAQAIVIQDLYQIVRRLSHLNRNLLLLAKMDNGQFTFETIDVVLAISNLVDYFGNIAPDRKIVFQSELPQFMLKANRVLLETMLSNMVVNALRHSSTDREIAITLSSNRLAVTNVAVGGALNKQLIFKRFYRSSQSAKGLGLGLSIVKSICTYHGWQVDYDFQDGRHVFSVAFGT